MNGVYESIWKEAVLATFFLDIVTERHGRVVRTLLILFGRYMIQISARRPAILTYFFRGFPQSLHANEGTVP
jgi:hypothetical protein